LEWLGLGWALYLALTTAALVAGGKIRFYIWWAILTALLVLNGAGCRVMLGGLNNLH
jgi:hypothetical protein